MREPRRSDRSDDAVSAAEVAPGTDAVDNYGLPPVLQVSEVAAFLGVNTKTVYEAIARGELPGKRIGRRRIVILRDALLRSLASQERVSPSGGRRR